MNFKKRVNGSWTDTPHYIHKTDTDTFTLPHTIYGDGTNATITLKGNTTQNGTPTPTTPIQPSECGERTGNILPSASEQTLTSSGITIRCDGNGRYYINGTATSSSFIIFPIPDFLIPVSVGRDGNGTFSMFNTAVSSEGTLLFQLNGTKIDDWILNSINRTSTGYSVMGGKTINQLVFSFPSGTSYNGIVSPMFTDDGILPSEYEPYGYKIPISSANTTTPVYLGEVESTRRIKKYEFTGQETINSATDSITETGTRVFVYRYSDLGMGNICDYSTPMNQITYPQFFCSHFFEKTEDLDSFKAIKNGECGANSQTSTAQNLFLIFASNEYTTNSDFKSYLAQQYANGTPVTVWYALANEETGIVNEPIRKIGDYADTVSDITIPTIAGADTLSVDTTLQPSEVSATYHGWHKGTVHERESGAWD